MAFVIADRVQETTTTVGTGTVALAGAVTGYQTFAVIGDGSDTYYAIAAQAGTDWEVGIGTYFLANTSLSRTTVLASSNANTAVTFGPGTKSVFITYPAERAIYANSSNITTITNFASGNVAITGGTITGVTYGDLGTMSLQNANNVSITNGSINVNYLATNNANLTGGVVTGVGFASSNVTITGGTINNVSLSNVTYGGLGTISTQNANSVTITGGTLNNVIIGGTTAANGSFTNLTLTNQVIANASSGASGQVLTSAGANASPYWANAATQGISGLGNSSIAALNVNITSNVTINAGINGFSVGPVYTANGVSVTVSSGQRWVVI